MSVEHNRLKSNKFCLKDNSRKERPNRSTNNGDIVDIAKRNVSDSVPARDGVRKRDCDIYVIREKLSFQKEKISISKKKYWD